MASSARAARVVPLTPEAALTLWTDTSRWATFVEGFARVLERSPDWPGEGGKVVWESTPEGRGRVTERVVEHAPGRLVTRVFEEALHGRQVMNASEHAEGALVELELEYELARYGPLRVVADVIFIRRALRDSLARTLRSFAVEAEEEVGLR
jgi:polyketide cyclase/dehydrase/lipid transport protein